MQNKYTSTLIKTIASFFGAGYSSLASGTVASFFAAILWWFLPDNLSVQVAAVITVLIISVPVSTAAETLFGKKDDSRIVIDEVVGQWASLLFIPNEIKYFAAAFILFRIYDVIKPLGIRKIQALPGGWGIVLDDLLAGILANVTLRLVIYLSGLI